jgi:hypothetical protein
MAVASTVVVGALLYPWWWDRRERDLPVRLWLEKDKI